MEVYGLRLQSFHYPSKPSWFFHIHTCCFRHESWLMTHEQKPHSFHSFIHVGPFLFIHTFIWWKHTIYVKKYVCEKHHLQIVPQLSVVTHSLLWRRNETCHCIGQFIWQYRWQNTPPEERISACSSNEKSPHCYSLLSDFVHMLRLHGHWLIFKYRSIAHIPIMMQSP